MRIADFRGRARDRDDIGGHTRCTTARMRCWLVAILITGCGGSAMSTTDAGCSETPVSFQHDVVPLIGHCGSEQCHGGLGTSWPYDSLVGVASTQCTDGRELVVPGDPANSYLLQKLDGKHMCMGVRMPRFGQPLTTAQTDTIATWICQGAPNN
jgi:hypothetical protein